MMEDHHTRCPWIRQNDANSKTSAYLCGAAAVQMILYGRDDTKFQVGQPTQLHDSESQLRIDQGKVWRSIVDESRVCPLPAGAHYDGSPERHQICEGSFCWATFPDALKNTITHGVTVTAGSVAGVAAKVRSPGSETALEQAIVDSLDRDVAAAVLVDGTHWIVVYRYRVLGKDDEVEIHYRDGEIPKMSSKPWDDWHFQLEVAGPAKGSYRDRVVGVTASSGVPLARRVMGRPPFRVPERPPGDVPTGRAVLPFRDAIAAVLAAERARDREWELAFTGARFKFALGVERLDESGRDYYLVDYEAPRDLRDPRSPVRRTGSVLVDAYDHRPRVTAGIDAPEQELPPLLGHEEIRRLLDKFEGYPLVVGGTPIRLQRSRLRMEERLVWKRCDQSQNPFMPFYVIRQASPMGGTEATAYLRADGELFPELTHTLGGV